MEVQLLETSRSSFVKPERQGSLYDETPLFGNLVTNREKFLNEKYNFIVVAPRSPHKIYLKK